MQACRFYLAMIVVQLGSAGSSILIKIALNGGLNLFVFIVYRHAIGFLFLFPFAYVLERKQRPRLSFSVFAKIFLLSSIGITFNQNLYYWGFAYVSPTVANALINIVPSLTFILAVLFRMERVKINSARGRAKVLGTIICVGGSLLFTVWKGGYKFKSLVDRPLINTYSTNDGVPVGGWGQGKDNWVKGSALIIVSQVAWSAWLVLQATVFEVYPAPLSLNVLICFIASLQSSCIALFFARNPLLWKLEWNERLLTLIYVGVMQSGLLLYLQIWCLSNKGPVFTSMFSPLQVVIVGIVSAIAFAERLHIGSLVGALIIIVGFYCILWGKRKDEVAGGNEGDNCISAQVDVLEISVIDSPQEVTNNN